MNENDIVSFIKGVGKFGFVGLIGIKKDFINKRYSTMGKVVRITKEKAKELLEKGFGGAERLLKTPYKVENLLNKTESILKEVPKVGKELSYVPVMISLVRSYIKKEYTHVPVRTIIAIVSALLYVVNPADLIPDAIPGIGFLDDAAVINVCWDLVKSDVKEYEEWRRRHNK